MFYAMGNLMLVLAGLSGFLGVYTFVRGAKRKVAHGVVVGDVPEYRHRAMYYPKVEFKTAAGETVVFTARFGSTRRAEPGRKVRVLYHPEAPAPDADISSLGDIWLLPFLLLDTGPEKRYSRDWILPFVLLVLAGCFFALFLILHAVLTKAAHPVA